MFFLKYLRQLVLCDKRDKYLKLQEIQETRNLIEQKYPPFKICLKAQHELFISIHVVKSWKFNLKTPNM